jgi:ankyrin repeat protein
MAQFIDVQDKEVGWSALMNACYNGHLSIVLQLLYYEANMELQDLKGYTAIMLACNQGYDKIVRLLLEYGADVDARNNDSDTPLMIASHKGYVRCVKILLEYNAGVLAKNFLGCNALMCAEHNGHCRVTKILLEKMEQLQHIRNIYNCCVDDVNRDREIQGRTQEETDKNVKNLIARERFKSYGLDNEAIMYLENIRGKWRGRVPEEYYRQVLKKFCDEPFFSMDACGLVSNVRGRMPVVDVAHCDVYARNCNEPEF